MSDDLRKFLRNAKTLGFSPNGIDGRGHIRLLHDNGRKMSISSSPSRNTTRRNELVRMQRIAGHKLKDTQ